MSNVKDVISGESHPSLFEKVVAHIVGVNNLNEFNPQNLANRLKKLRTRRWRKDEGGDDT